MFADSFSGLSIHCVARKLDASFLYKCPASRGGSMRQHGLLVFLCNRTTVVFFVTGQVGMKFGQNRQSVCSIEP